jgi:F-box and WD-40 domain protein MET30
MCCFSQLSLLSEQLSHLIRIDPFTVLPSEVSLKILGHLDATSLCRAAQVSKRWKGLADDDILWRGICEQHIGQKCLKCGWGLPILEKRRAPRLPSPAASPSPLPTSVTEFKRKRETDLEQPPLKRHKSGLSDDLSDASSRPSSPALPPQIPESDIPASPPYNPLLAPIEPAPCNPLTRPWKDVYCERLTIERNWRRGRCTVRTLSGHTDGVMCLQFSETLTHPAFPILITGSYDRTARVWNLETGREIHCLIGHTRAVRALQFDEAKLITGSMDHTMRVWDWRTGKCLRVLEGHTEGVVCLNFDSNVLASGSVDTTVKVWNFRTGECFTLRGHRDWVNAVQLWDSNATTSSGCLSGSTSNLWDAATSASGDCSKPCIDPGKMLFSASDDGTIRLWDLAKRTCLRQFTGHVGQVQSLKLLMVDEACGEPVPDLSPANSGAAATGKAKSCELSLGTSRAATPNFQRSLSHVAFPPDDDAASSSRLLVHHHDNSEDAKGREHAVTTNERSNKRLKPVLISGSLDNTIKIWDLDTGKAVQTLFGHIEGVWAVASDKLRLVSGSHDRTIKVNS